jgi:AraC-like DNA-binding protein
MHELELLRTVIGRHAHNAHLQTELDGLTISATDEPTDVRSGIAEPTLAVVAQGSKRTVLGDGVFDYSAAEFLVVTIEAPVVGRVTEASATVPFLGCGVRLDAAEIATLILDSAPSVRDPAGRTPTIASARADDNLIAAVSRFVALLDSPADAAVLAPLYRREILWRLLTGPCGRMIRGIGLADNNLADIARTLRWIRENYREPVRVDDLASLAGMSASTYHRHFRAVTRMTPIQYQKAVRLQEARASLLEGQRDVSQVAHAVGYDSASQFSREYRRQFGAPPGRDAVRLRHSTIQPVAVP